MYIPKFSLGDCEGSAKSSLLNQLAEFRTFLMNQNFTLTLSFEYMKSNKNDHFIV